MQQTETKPIKGYTTATGGGFTLPNQAPVTTPNTSLNAFNQSMIGQNPSPAVVSNQSVTKQIPGIVDSYKQVTGQNNQTPFGIPQQDYNNFKAANPDVPFDSQEYAHYQQADTQPKADLNGTTGDIAQQSLAGDPQGQAITKLYTNAQAKNDASLAESLKNIQERSRLLTEEQTRQNALAENSVRNSLIMSGASRVDQINTAGVVKQTIDNGISRLSKLNLDEADLVAQAHQAYNDQDYKLLKNITDQINQNRTEKQALAAETNKKMADLQVKAEEQKRQANKDSIVGEAYSAGITDPVGIMNYAKSKGENLTAAEIQATIGNIVPAGLDELVKQLRSSGAPTEVIQAVLASKNINDAYKAAGSYATSGGTGQLGLYNNYRAQAVALGQPPMEMGDFFAALKPKNLGASGLDPATLTKVQTVANKFDTEQIVKDYNTVATQIDAVNNLGVTPTDDVQRIYAFAKVMDPNSAVREGEYSTIQNYSTALMQKYGLNANRVFNNDGFLTTEARNFLQNTLQNRLNSQEKAYNNVAEETARKINNITGKDDGKEYITDYSKAFTVSKDNIEKEKQATSDLTTLKQTQPQTVQKNFDAYHKAYGKDPSTAEEYFQFFPEDRPQKQSFNQVVGDTNPAKGIVSGVNITSYATDPQHEQKIASIVSKIPSNGTFDYDKYIRSIAPKSPVTGNMITTASSTYGVDPRLVLAIIQNDSSFGTKGHGATNNNPGNIGQFDKLKGSVKGYPSMQEGVLAVAKWLASHKTQKYA